MATLEEYKHGMRDLRTTFGRSGEDVPIAVLHQNLALLSGKKAQFAQASFEWGDGGRNSGSWFLLTDSLVISGTWQDARVHSYIGRGGDTENYECVAVSRKTLKSVAFASSDGTAWTSTDFGSDASPWPRGARIVLTYETLGQVTLPLGHVNDSRAFEAVLRGLLGDL